ncbi:MAG: NUDIX hydrolase [bacterium]
MPNSRDPSLPRVPSLTVDGVVLLWPSKARETGTGSVLLVERGIDPYRGSWVFPGGFVEYGEDLLTAVQREVAEEAGLEGLPFVQFQAYGDPQRDPRGHTVSVVFVANLTGKAPPVQGGDDAAQAAWFPLHNIPELGFDHKQILTDIFSARGRG